MRRYTISLFAISGLILTACGPQGQSDEELAQALKDVNVIDESNLNDVMLTVADPNEAVSYFQRTLAVNPTRIDLARGLAISLVRAGKATAAATAWSNVLGMEGANSEDRVEFADALIRSNQWDRAETELDKIPPTHETFKRYRLEAMIADSNKDWKKADSFYQTAVGLTTKPSGTLNNWGYSNLTRGNYVEAERLFGEALTYDSTMFTAKNNLVLARAAQRRYEMPVVPMTQRERAQLIHTAALSAIKQGDINTGKSLLQDAIDTHPQFFEAAVRSLEALDNQPSN